MDMQLFEHYKNQMQTGDLLVFRSDGIIPAIIRKKTKSEYSHVALVIVFSEAPKWVFLIHASKHTGGVVPILASRELIPLKGVAAWVPLDHEKAQQINPEYKADIAYEALMLFGLKYNMNTLWRAFLPFMKWLIPALYEAFCCSFAAAHCLKRAKLLEDSEITQQQLVDHPMYKELVPLWPVGHFYASY